MNTNRIVGVVLLVVGVALFVIGMNASHSMADRMSDFFRGRLTDATTWYIVGGIAAGVLGLVILLAGLRGKNA